MHHSTLKRDSIIVSFVKKKKRRGGGVVGFEGDALLAHTILTISLVVFKKGCET